MFLERRNDMIEIHQIGPCVKKKGRSNNRQDKDKGATNGDEKQI